MSMCEICDNPNEDHENITREEWIDHYNANYEEAIEDGFSKSSAASHAQRETENRFGSEPAA